MFVMKAGQEGSLWLLCTAPRIGAGRGGPKARARRTHWSALVKEGRYVWNWGL